jgi:hypothetical protein
VDDGTTGAETGDRAPGRDRFRHLPDPVRSDDLVAEVPVDAHVPDVTVPFPPAGAPEVGAATSIADAHDALGTRIRRTPARVGLVVVGVPLGLALVAAGLVALLA